MSLGRWIGTSLRGPRACPQHGLTLLEILIALTLLGLMMGMAAGGVRLGARVWEGSAARADVRHNILQVDSVVRRQLTQALPILWEGASGAPIVAFAGDSESVVFVARHAAQSLPPGLYLIHLAFERAGHEGRLVLRWRSFDAEAGRFQMNEPAEAIELLRGIDSLNFAYYGPDDIAERSAWHRDWTERDRLPELVRLSIAFVRHESRVWHPLVVRPVIDTLTAHGR